LIDNTLEGRQKLFFPHFFNGAVPLDPERNRQFRLKHFLTAKESDRRQIRRMCAEDFLFYLAGFVYLFDAGDETGKPGPVPFLPYEMQVECFTMMWAAMHADRCPLRGKKPRRMGFSWGAVAMFEHCWHFMANRHLLIGSHREEEVDGTMALSKGGGFVGEWSKLMPKFDFIHLYEPIWLLPRGYVPRVEPYRVRMKLMNPENGSIVWGTSAASLAGHGERGYAVFWDESSRTENLYDIIGGLQAFAPCKFWLSTIGNLDHPFSTILKDAPGVMQLNPEWWMHPDYSEGLTIDAETGQRTSPWLQKKLEEINYDPVLANQLYYADETQQQGGYYSRPTFLKLLGTSDKPGTVMEPLHRGELDIIDTPEGPRVTRFCQQSNGRWQFWLAFDANGRPPRGTKYILGVDVAAGSQDERGRGASNSVIAVADWLTGEIVAEFVTHGKMPFELVDYAQSAAYWFEGEDFQPGKVIWERNGPGAEFGAVLVKKRGFTNVFLDHAASSTETKYGWHKDGRGESAKVAFGLHQQMICDGRLKERSEFCVQEMRHYQHNPNGKGAPIHSASLMSQDPSGARDNHGDRVIARVCICQLLQIPYEVSPMAGQAPARSYRAAKEREVRESYATQLV
jgi:hypothetical protein